MATPPANLVEVTEQPPMAEWRESREVVCSHVNRLQEGRRGEDAAVTLEHTPELADTSLRISNVFQHGDCEDEIEILIRERQVVRIGDHLDMRSECDVGMDNLIVLGAVADSPSTDHQHARPCMAPSHLGKRVRVAKTPNI